MSILDLIPEYETPMMHESGNGTEKCFCLKERTCARCGKVFYFRMGQTAYTRKIKGKLLRFCSWSCKCADERVRKVGKQGGCMKSIEQRIAEREAKIAEDKARLGSGKIGEKEKTRLTNRMQRLHKEVKALKEEV